MSGIPGTVGAAPVQNIGAYGQEIQETLVEVDLIDAHADVSVTVPAAELGLGFRTSVLKHHYGSEPQRRAVILSVTLDLLVAGERVVRGEQLRRALGLQGDEPVSLAWVRERIIATRRVEGHDPRRGRPRHPRHRVVLPERDRAGVGRARAAGGVPALARDAPTSTP